MHSSIADDLLATLRQLYDNLSIGNPFDTATLVGPLIDAALSTGWTFRMTAHPPASR